jgi:hypothetical protein
MLDDVLAGRAAWHIAQGHTLDSLRALPDGCVSCAVCSPPYYGLRAYKTEPQVWPVDGCATHEWGMSGTRGVGRTDNGRDFTGGGGNYKNGGPAYTKVSTGAFCVRGCWRGELGSEPTPDLYIAHLVEVFREVKRVLHPSGTCWVNLGSSYATVGRSRIASNGAADPSVREGRNSSEKGGKVRGIGVVHAEETYLLRDDLRPDEVAYVLAELAAHHRQRSEVALPKIAVGVDPAVAPLADGKEI